MKYRWSLAVAAVFTLWVCLAYGLGEGDTHSEALIYHHYRHGYPLGREVVYPEENGWRASARFENPVDGVSKLASKLWLEDRDAHFSLDLTDATGKESRFEGPLLVANEDGAPESRIEWSAFSAGLTIELCARVRQAIDNADYMVDEWLNLNLRDRESMMNYGCRVLGDRRLRVPLADDVLELRVLTVDMLGPTTLVFDKGGKLLRFVVPSRHVDLVLESYEWVPRFDSELVEPWQRHLSIPSRAVVVDHALRVKMADGVNLVADVHRPAGEGQYPAVLIRTPYNRKETHITWAYHLARCGYAVVTQDVRGRFDSQGNFEPFVREAADGADTIDWIVAQPWSNTRIGLLGASYPGACAWLAASASRHAVHALVAKVATRDGERAVLPAGLDFEWLRWLSRLEAHRDDSGRIDEDPRFLLPLGDMSEAIDQHSDVLTHWLSFPRGHEYWAAGNYQARVGEIDVPALHVTGWRDGNLLPAIENFSRGRAAGREDRFLIIGAWDHQLDEGKQGFGALDDRILRFLDAYLKGDKNGTRAEPPVRLVGRGHELQLFESWPPLGSRELILHGHGATLSHEAEGSRIDRYHYRPHEAPQVFSPRARAGALVSVPENDDVLDFLSPRLRQKLVLAGNLRLRARVSTTAEDADVACVLYRQVEFKAGQSAVEELARGVVRLSLRNGVHLPVSPGAEVDVRIELGPIYKELPAYSRLLLRVGGSLFPESARNMGTLESALGATIGLDAEIVLHGGVRLELPVLGESSIEFAKD